MASKDDGEISKPAKRQRKVSFSANTTKDPNSCIVIRLVSSAHEMQPGEATVPEFSPDFAEHFFGEDRKIFGYKNLKIIIWLHALSFHAHIEICHTEVVQDTKGGKQQVTDLPKVFKEIFGAGLIEDRAVFLELLAFYNDSSDFIRQHGKRVAAWRLSEQSWIKIEDDTSEASKEILHLEDLTAQELKDWHARLTPLALMFIEAATPIEIKDPRWEVYVCLEKAAEEYNCPWRIVGFCRVYRFFKYPDSTRLRVSQILVLPPYRGKQNGFHLLEAVYKSAVARGSFEVTMEEPSSDLQVLRECMDAVSLLSFDPVRSELQRALSKLKRDSELNGSIANFQAWSPSPSVVENVRQTFKVCKSQFRYCWQVLMYLHIMGEVEEKVLSSFQSLVAWSLKLEVFGNSKSADVGKNKLLLDVENEYDSSRSFVMVKVKPSVGNGSNGVVKAGELESAHLKEAVDMDPEANAENAFQELLKEREEEINQVAEKVMQYLKVAGILLVEV
ncbi:hypothetical protein L7F22_010108 [Adiantum nelumboides]|nr:hypothetical protein [Adiantum nelumboides]